MGIAVNAIQTLIGSYPTGLFTAHHWFNDSPADTDPTFAGAGFFIGGDLPFGVIYELHDAPAGKRFKWVESIQYVTPLGHIVNNAKILAGFGSSVPVEEFFFDRPRGMLLFHEPSTTSIIVEMLQGAFVELWGLYIDIPLIGITQPTWTPTPDVPAIFPTTFDGTVFAGLTDSGTLAIDPGAVGVRIDATTVPTALGSEAGDPVRIFDLGWINWADINGFRTRERVTSAHWESFPRKATLSDVLGFTFHPGVVATVTCLMENV
jgi:hypothetical protein